MVVSQCKNFLRLLVSTVYIRYALKTDCPIYRALGQRVYNCCTAAATYDALECLPRARPLRNRLDVLRSTFVSMKYLICIGDWLYNKYYKTYEAFAYKSEFQLCFLFVYLHNLLLLCRVLLTYICLWLAVRCKVWFSSCRSWLQNIAIGSQSYNVKHLKCKHVISFKYVRELKIIC